MGYTFYPTYQKPKLALAKLTNDESFKDVDPVEAMAAYQEVFDKYIRVVKASDEVDRYDIEGNVLPKKHKDDPCYFPLFGVSKL